ncbi:MAG: hypothetical protein J5709_03205 [Bacteroidales bacterium]|nr:hypothetical protein [Bacteroidales bacterium]
MIKRKAQILEKLICQYPKLLEDWNKDLFAQLKNEAIQEACGDKEVEESIFSEKTKTLDDEEDLKNIFYQSMLLMVVAYYESVVTLFAKHANSGEIIKAICSKKNIELSKESLDDVEYIDEEVNALRNNVCHNNSGTPRKTDVLQRISNNSKDIHFNGDMISITGPNYILSVLEKETKILLELADKLGYKNKLYSNGLLKNIPYVKKDDVI